MSDLFGKSRNKDVAAISRIKHWVQEIFKLSENENILVTELQCYEEGCPPIETVIVVLRGETEKRQYKFHKRINEINFEDIANLTT